MNGDFPSTEGLTWQEWRANTFPMESNDLSANHADNICSAAEGDRGTLSNQGRHLYFIKIAKGRGPVKIGRANNPQVRLATLQVASPYRLKLVGTLEDCGEHEPDWHWFLRDHRMLGEWFGWSKLTEETVKLALDGGDWRSLVAVRPIPVITADDWRIGSPLYAGNPKYPHFQARP